ncbi:uncharacterized protein K452DRAFT_361306 [Aplosporella prunicola CBS 121167]|uniref:Pyoverdine/dityrosine biosynthesis protein n=1 Tax=Aplosporella prunicola CBS 121167 TaxID=1176127 RepID=A0A6A6B210_9PEZI|nr:uncharacterized protein K452DRAFT_361306 [Aplosporella prunicola CBS 121167]KAF2138219.1 hypothetical protein K452DRAFT_361306 [Aplosporella prunicola CBS 121167]
MASLNSGTSVFHGILGLYWRDTSGSLIAVEGRRTAHLHSLWPQIWKHISRSPGGDHRLVLPSQQEVKSYYLTVADDGNNNNDDVDEYAVPVRHDSPLASPGIAQAYHVRELFDEERKLVRGVLATATEPSSLSSLSSPGSSYFTSPESSITDLSALSLDNDDDHHQTETFESWALLFFLLETRLQPFPAATTSTPTSEAAQAQSTAAHIATIFSTTLRNTAALDQWATGGGRAFFTSRVQGFVAANQPIELCLPAFPCKSPNPDKVGGRIPDRAERIALDAVQGFLEAVAEVYEPGCTFWLISDGHVFANCIGADDTTVDTYDADVKTLYQRLHGRAPSNCRIRFKSLTDIFGPSSPAFSLFHNAWATSTAATDLAHPVPTARTADADFSRGLLMRLCAIDARAFRALVEAGDAKTLALYRGMCRFMETDLSAVSQCRGLSRKALKRVAAGSAGEMIGRNHAYSNLVELLFPNHVRLSIHAHNNAGPKFGIRLFPAARNIAVIASLDAVDEPQPTEFAFQTPTPWHNCVVEIVSSPSPNEGESSKDADPSSKDDEGPRDGERKGSEGKEGEGVGKEGEGEMVERTFIARSGVVKKALQEGGGWVGEWVGGGVLGEGRWRVQRRVQRRVEL